MSLLFKFFGFFTIATALVVAAHAYFYLRLVRDAVQRPWLKRLGLAVVAGAALSLFVGPWVASRFPSPWTHVLVTGTWTWLGVSTYLFLCLAAAGSTRTLYERMGKGAPHSPERRVVLSQLVAGSALAVSGGVGGYGVFRAFTPPEVTELSVRVQNLPRALEGFTVVQVSDLHVGPIIQRRFIEEVVRVVNRASPDLVALTGDLVDGSVAALGSFVAALANLRSRYGTFFVTGNHDYYSGAGAWCSALQGLGMTVLRNRHVSIGNPGASFDLVGVDDWGGTWRPSDYDLERAVLGRDPARPAVLLAHQPVEFEAVAGKGIGLMLAGHTHGGQLFPMTELVQLRYPRYAGLYTHQQSSLYVSRGTGFWGPPMRVGSPPEVVKVVLLPA